MEKEKLLKDALKIEVNASTAYAREKNVSLIELGCLISRIWELDIYQKRLNERRDVKRKISIIAKEKGKNGKPVKTTI